MSFTNIKLNQERGFTIVELLIVVVGIAILAALSSVSYTGITNRANDSSAKSTLSGIKKKIELYNTDVGTYPISYTTLTNTAAQSESWGIKSGAIGSATPNPTNGTDYIQVQACRSSTATLSASNVTGTRLTYYEYDKTGGAGLTTVDLLAAGVTSCANVTNLNT
jgi:type IV pilus assembly protein PilA